MSKRRRGDEYLCSTCLCLPCTRSRRCRLPPASLPCCHLKFRNSQVEVFCVGWQPSMQTASRMYLRRRYLQSSIVSTWSSQTSLRRPAYAISRFIPACVSASWTSLFKRVSRFLVLQATFAGKTIVSPVGQHRWKPKLAHGSRYTACSSFGPAQSRPSWRQVIGCTRPKRLSRGK